jgi:hypothetical protein
MREVTSGRALWLLLLLTCPLIGYSFLQAVSLYAEASIGAAQSPVMAASLSPLDGVLVPTFGAAYVAATLMFPFVAIRALSAEKETGALRLLVQLPYPMGILTGAKLAVIMVAWLAAMVPALSALVLWRLMGGHLAAAETAALVFGHALYGLLVGSIALFAASVAESGAVAAIIALAFTIGSWVLDFTLAGRPGLLERIAKLSLTEVLRPFEQGLLSAGTILGTGSAILGFATLAGIWLPPGMPIRRKAVRSVLCVTVVLAALGLAAQINLSVDVTEDHRNSFPPADERALAALAERLVVTVHLAPEDPRYADLQRNVLAKLGRAMPRVTIRLADKRQTVPAANDDAYGEVEYAYAGRNDASRSTSPREILPLVYRLAGVEPPQSLPAADYPGYPLVARDAWALAWFFAGLPLLVALAWWRCRRPARLHRMTYLMGGAT